LIIRMVIDPVRTEAFHKAIRTKVQSRAGNIQIVSSHHAMCKTNQLPFGNHDGSALNNFGGKAQNRLFGLQASRTMPFNTFLGKFSQELRLILIDPFKMPETDMPI